MFRAYNYFNVFSAPLACYFAVGKGLGWALFCLGLAFAVHPLMDWLLNGPFNTIVTSLKSKSPKTFSYDIPLLLSVPFQILLVLHAFIDGSATLTDALLSGALCGLSGGILGISSAHELMHRPRNWERTYGKLMLHTINYPHFFIEHLWHHIHVATPEDADTAREGESIYRFLSRSIPEGWMKCWKWSVYKKQMLKMTLIQTAIMSVLFLLGGREVFLVYLVQGLVTLLLLKWINYVEHYGLKRKLVNGTFEPTGIKHSWDSLSPLTNFSLFNLGFHTYHHKRPTAPYYQLPDSSPQWNTLPHGYSLMMLLTLFPKQWEEVMGKQIAKLDS